MRLLLDQGLPRAAVLHLQENGIEATHVGELGLSGATDAAILELARQQGSVVVTLDADFHAQLALSAASGPSVIRIRVEGLRAQKLAELLAIVLKVSREDLLHGAMISVTESSVRIRRLPLFG